MTWQRTDAAYFAAAALACVGLGILFFPLFAAMLGTDDFATIWAGPRALLLGLDPYDVATWRDVSVQIGSERYPSVTGVYLYPPWVTIALLPFALVPASIGAIVWTVVGMAAAIITLRSLLHACLPDNAWEHAMVGFVLFASAPAAVTFVSGQWTFFLLAGVAAIVLWLRDDRPVAAGLASLIMLVKPPIFVFSAIGLVLRAVHPSVTGPPAERRAVLFSTLAGVLTIAISWMLVPSWWPAWFYHVAAVQVTITPVTPETLFTAVFGPLGPWLAAAFVLVGTIVALEFDRHGDAWLPVWLALSSAAVIYSNTYDALLILIPMVLASGALRQRSPRRSALVLVTGAILLFPVMWFLHLATTVRLYAAIVPLTMFVVIATTLWPWRHAAGGARPLSDPYRKRRFNSR